MSTCSHELCFAPTIISHYVYYIPKYPAIDAKCVKAVVAQCAKVENSRSRYGNRYAKMDCITKVVDPYIMKKRALRENEQDKEKVEQIRNEFCPAGKNHNPRLLTGIKPFIEEHS